MLAFIVAPAGAQGPKGMIQGSPTPPEPCSVAPWAGPFGLGHVSRDVVVFGSQELCVLHTAKSKGVSRPAYSCVPPGRQSRPRPTPPGACTCQYSTCCARHTDAAAAAWLMKVIVSRAGVPGAMPARWADMHRSRQHTWAPPAGRGPRNGLGMITLRARRALCA